MFEIILLEKYPSSQYDTSLSTYSECLTVLSTSIIAMTPMDNDLHQLNEFYRNVQHNLSILKELSLVKFACTTDSNPKQNGPKRKNSQAARKQTRRPTLQSKLDVDVKLFCRAGIAVPNTEDEVENVANDCLNKLKDVLIVSVVFIGYQGLISLLLMLEISINA